MTMSTMREKKLHKNLIATIFLLLGLLGACS